MRSTESQPYTPVHANDATASLNAPATTRFTNARTGRSASTRAIHANSGSIVNQTTIVGLPSSIPAETPRHATNHNAMTMRYAMAAVAAIGRIEVSRAPTPAHTRPSPLAITTTMLSGSHHGAARSPNLANEPLAAIR
ncbi:hypothetical protein L5G32_00485 [Gordonia sp. HY002]|uniref:hypothetical protein n=1 Tax=Gordonia zhenghanii TaxID=2911516 RepID=UPI001F1AF3DD|nr:hypothetical protein [Gordonia zhenghanii]MCF8568743.1 hypothetical protein [Gordonia zhenghanii]